ncbi:MAG: PAS domain S-box protein [Desulfomonilia bacterium]|jgi:PAS domain S-box-containing protein
MKTDRQIRTPGKVSGTSGFAEEMYRKFFEHSLDALVYCDDQGIIGEANRAFRRLVGCAKPEIRGRAFKEFFSNPEDIGRLLRQVRKKEAELKEARLRGADQTFRECRILVHPMESSAGAVIGYMVIIRDMTRTVQDYEDLKATVRNLSDRVRELNCLYEISEAIDLKGRTFPEIVQGVLRLVPSITSYPEITAARLTIDGGVYLTDNFQQTPWRMESEIQSRCHTVGSVEVFYLQERPERFEGPFTRDEKRILDIIAARLGRLVSRKRAEEMITESEQRYRSLFEDSRDAIYTSSRDGIILDANEAALELFGYSRSEMIGKHVGEIYVARDDRSKFQQEVEDKGAVRNFEVLLKKKDGSIMNCLYTSSVRKSAQGEIIGYHSIVHDITELKRIEEERQDLIEELRLALENIKTLRGLVPICASCKKIRDDKGYWNRIEEYIEAHSEAVFSHGLCPECQKRFEEE